MLVTPSLPAGSRRIGRNLRVRGGHPGPLPKIVRPQTFSYERKRQHGAPYLSLLCEKRSNAEIAVAC
jgi:hypothetical protein